VNKNMGAVVAAELRAQSRRTRCDKTATRTALARRRPRGSKGVPKGAPKGAKMVYFSKLLPSYISLHAFFFLLFKINGFHQQYRFLRRGSCSLRRGRLELPIKREGSEGSRQIEIGGAPSAEVEFRWCDKNVVCLWLRPRRASAMSVAGCVTKSLFAFGGGQPFRWAMVCNRH
jgi:hypothetical protein